MKTLILLALALLSWPVSAQVSVTATAGTPGPTSYTTLKGAFDAINAGTHQAAVSVSITGNTTETASAVINASGSGSANYTSVTIMPSGGAARMISGSVSSGALIKFNGADHVTLDGSLNGTASRDLSIINTSATAPTVISLASLGTGEGATHNVIENCNLGTGVTNSSSYGISVGGSTPGTAGADNDNITLQNNSITVASFGIYARGTAAVSAGGDDNLTIRGNHIDHNFTGFSGVSSIGIRVGNSVASTVSQNTVSQQTTAFLAPTAISLETGFVFSSVTRNTVTKSQNFHSGGFGGRGITVGTGTEASAVTIANNVIYGVNGTNNNNFGASSSMGIAIGTIGNSSSLTTITGGINLYFNSVNMTGSMGANPTALTAAIYIGSGASALDIRNNIFGNTQVGTSAGQKNYAIFSAAANTAFTTINFNDYFVSNTLNATSAIPGFLTTDQLNLADIQTGFGQNVNSSTAGPPFNSATDLRPLPASPVVDTGESLSSSVSPYEDYTGAMRLDPPSMGAYETGIDSNPPTISYTPLLSTLDTGDRILTTTITHPFGVPTSGAGLPVLHWKINAEAYSSTQATSLGGGQYQFTFGSGAVAGDTVTFYLVAQSSVASNPNVVASPASGASGFTANPPAAATPPTAPNTYAILDTISGVKTVGSGGNYATLTAAVADLNAKVLNGPVTLTLTDATYASETFPIIIDANAGSSPTNTITIKPSAATTLSGAVASGAIIKINGARWVTVDGSNNGSASRDMTLTNTATMAPTVISLVSLGSGAGATYGVIKNCNLSTGVATTIGYGISVGGSTPGTQGADNDNVTLQNNAITAAPVGIYAVGTTSVSAGGNDNLSITGNSIDYNGTLASIGIRTGNALNSSVSQNSVSEETPALYAPTAISLETGFVSSSVTRNTVAKSLNNSKSTWGGRGITVGTGTATSALTIANNVIYGVNGSNWSRFGDSSSMGIAIGTIGHSQTLTTVTGGVNLYFNSVSMTGSMGTSSSTAITTAIYIGSGASALDIRNNIFANTQVGRFTGQKNYAIYSAAANTAFTTINSNDYFVSNTFNAASAIAGFLISDRVNLAAIQAGLGQNSNSISADPLFNAATNLQLLPGSPGLDTGESLSSVVSPYVDFTGMTRVDPPGMGAYEIGSDTTPPTITYTPLLKTLVTGNRTLIATITDVTGVPTAGTGLPVLYWKINAAAYTSVQATPLGGGQYQFTFGAGAVLGDAVSYYLVAQDTAASSNVGASPSSGAAGFAASPPAAATPPTTPESYGLFAIAGTKTVGSGGDYATLTAAVADLNAKILNGPLTLTLTDTTYPSEIFPIVINANPGSSASNTITIKPSATTTISGAISYDGLIKINAASWVTIDGSNNGGTSRDLTITNTSTTAPTVILMVSLGNGAGATHDVIKNCNVSTGAATSIGYGIALGGPDNDNVTLQNNAITAAPIGIYAVGWASVSAGGNDNLSIIGNTIDYDGTLASIGIQVGRALNSCVSQNIISEQTSATQAPTAISLETGFVSSSVTRNTVIKSLTTAPYGYGGRGIAVGTETATSALTIANNVICGVNGSNWFSFQTSSMGIAIGVIGNSYPLTRTTGGIKLYSNSVSMTGSMGTGASTAITTALYIGSGAGALDIRNNVFGNTQVATSATQKNYAIYSDAPRTVFTTINHNNYFVGNTFNDASAIPGYLSSDRADLAGILAGFGQNVNSITADPLFTSATDLHITSPASPVSNVGSPLADVPMDFDGGTRSATTPDIGADEIGVTSPINFQEWAAMNGVTSDPNALGANGLKNLLNFAFGMSPTLEFSGPLVFDGTFAGGSIGSNGMPLTWFEPIPLGSDIRALFIRRKDFAATGLTYTPQFSANLDIFTDCLETPTVLAENGVYQIVCVSYPSFQFGETARFFRVNVTLGP